MITDQPQWGDLSNQGCDRDDCILFGGQQAVYSLTEAERVFFKKYEMQERIFGATIETIRELDIGVTHVCHNCGTWYFGMSAENGDRRKSEHSAEPVQVSLTGEAVGRIER